NVLSEIELRSRKEGLEHDLYKVIATFVEELNSLKELEKDHELTKKVNELALKFSHDMKSPIATLNTLLDHPDQLNENAELLKIVTARINDISTNLLDKRRDLRVEQFKLDALMEELIPQKEKEFKLSPRETIRVESSGNTLIEANKSEVSRLLSNLINNSIEASREVGRPLINISCSQEEGLVKLEIEDNGKGIDKNAIPAILQGKFSEKENGNGIGVSSAKKYLTSIGGDLLMVSQLGQGTKVTVQFPRIH
ncbi:MAG: GHKL domain-containing protein, partial [Deltaproteobacteria bacterium]